MILFLILLSVPTSSLAQTGSVTRPFTMRGKSHNNVTLSFMDGKLQSFVIINSYGRDDDSVKIKIYNSLPQYQWITPHVNTFVKNLIKIKEKYIEWDSIATVNKVDSFIKRINVWGPKDQPLWIKYEYPGYPFGEIARSYGNFKLGDSNIQFNPYFTIYKGQKYIGCTYNFEGRVYQSSTQEPILGANYNNYTYVTRQVRFYFFSPEELQSFIDALDIESAKRILAEKNKEDKKVDELFK